MKIRKIEVDEKAERMAYDETKEQEIDAAYVAFKEAQRRAKKTGDIVPIDSISRQGFHLYSTDYVEYID